MNCFQHVSLLVFIVFSTGLSGVDLQKNDPSQNVGGQIDRTIPDTNSSFTNRARHIPYKYKNQRGVPLKDMYKGSSHEKALDAQILAYRPNALKKPCYAFQPMPSSF